MTKEEAIDIIKSECYVFNPLNFDRSTMVNTALDMAVKALEQEPYEDAISRQAAKKALENRFMELQKRHSEDKYETNFCLNTILELPSVKPQYTEAEIQKIQELEQAQLEKAYEIGKAEQTEIGRWIDVENEEMETVGYYCSECDLPMETEQRTNFCPNCGCRMVESEEE